MKKKLKSEKYKGCTIKFTKETHPVLGGRFRSCPVIEAVIYGTNNIRLHTLRADDTKDEAFGMAKTWINKRSK